MRWIWRAKLNPKIRFFVSLSLICVFLALDLAFSDLIRPALISFLAHPLKLGQDIATNARRFLSFQDLIAENKRLKDKVSALTAQLIQLQEARLENQRLRSLLSLPLAKTYRTVAATVIGRDSSNWTSTLLINRGTKDGLQKGMPVVRGINLVGKIIEVYPSASKVALLVDYNSKIAAKLQRSREEGIVFGVRQGRGNVCRMKYIQQVQLKDKVITSGLGQIFPKGLLIGEVVKVEEAQNGLYKVAEIHPAASLSSLEEVMVIVSQGD